MILVLETNVRLFRTLLQQETRVTTQQSEIYRLLLALSGTRTTMLVPRPGAVRMSNDPFSFFTLARILTNPNPSLPSATVVIPRPLSFTLRIRFWESELKLTVIAVDLAWRMALLIAS